MDKMYNEFMKKRQEKLEEIENDDLSETSLLTDREGEILFEMFGLEADVLEKLALLKELSNEGDRDSGEILAGLNTSLRDDRFASDRHARDYASSKAGLLTDEVEKSTRDYIDASYNFLIDLYSSSVEKLEENIYYDQDRNYIYSKGAYYPYSPESIALLNKIPYDKL